MIIISSFVWKIDKIYVFSVFSHPYLYSYIQIVILYFTTAWSTLCKNIDLEEGKFLPLQTNILSQKLLETISILVVSTLLGVELIPELFFIRNKWIKTAHTNILILYQYFHYSNYSYQQLSEF